MREIKFRAWNKELNIMRNNSTIDCYNSELNRSFKENLMLTMDGEIRVCQWYGDRVSMREDNNYKLMQFTGLQDKNGVDIYECDVLQIISKYGVRPWSSQPGKKHYYKEPKIQNKLVRFDTEKACFEVDGTSFAYAKATNYEVIGNIYQNPELLTDNN